MIQVLLCGHSLDWAPLAVAVVPPGTANFGVVVPACARSLTTSGPHRMVLLHPAERQGIQASN